MFILQLKYKEIYEKLKGHYLAGKDIGDFPSVVHSLAFQKIRSAVRRESSFLPPIVSVSCIISVSLILNISNAMLINISNSIFRMLS